MNEIIKKIEAEQLKAEVPEFHVGDTVKVYAKVKEGQRERTQVFEGVVLKRQGGSTRETFTVRKFSTPVSTFPEGHLTYLYLVSRMSRPGKVLRVASN